MIPTATYEGCVVPVRTERHVAFVVVNQKRVLLSSFTALQRAEAHNQPLFRRVRGANEKWRLRVKRMDRPHLALKAQHTSQRVAQKSLGPLLSLPSTLCTHILGFLDKRSWACCALTCFHLRRLSVQRGAIVQFNADLVVDWISSNGARPSNIQPAVAVERWSLWSLRALQSLNIARGMDAAGLSCIGNLSALRTLSLWLYESWTPVTSIAPLRALVHLTRLVFGAGPFFALDFRVDAPNLRYLELARWNATQAELLPARLEHLRLPGIKHIHTLLDGDRTLLQSNPGLILKSGSLIYNDPNFRHLYVVGRHHIPWHLLDFKARASPTEPDIRSAALFAPFWPNFNRTRPTLVVRQCHAPTGFAPWVRGQRRAWIPFTSASAREEHARCHAAIAPTLARIDGEWCDAVVLRGSPAQDDSDVLRASFRVDPDTGDIDPSTRIALYKQYEDDPLDSRVWKSLIGVKFDADILYDLQMVTRENGACTLLWRVLSLQISRPEPTVVVHDVDIAE